MPSVYLTLNLIVKHKKNSNNKIITNTLPIETHSQNNQLLQGRSQQTIGIENKPLQNNTEVTSIIKEQLNVSVPEDEKKVEADQQSTLSLHNALQNFKSMTVKDQSSSLTFPGEVRVNYFQNDAESSYPSQRRTDNGEQNSSAPYYHNYSSPSNGHNHKDNNATKVVKNVDGNTDEIKDSQKGNLEENLLNLANSQAQHDDLTTSTATTAATGTASRQV